MDYNQFKYIFNEKIFEKSKADLLEKISKYPARYIGLFRPSKPKAKILQNLLQSHEIRFGDAFETLIESYLRIKGLSILQSKFKDANNEDLDIDLFFKKESKFFFVELKVRDDHDSTKKRGQILNFEKKLNALISTYNEADLIGIFYFIDPSLNKNKNFYEDEIKKMRNDYNTEIHIFYGKSLFEYLGYFDIWDELLNYLTNWKMEIPDLPEINFDLNAQNTFEEIKDLSPLIYRRLFENDKIFDEIILTLFPQRKTLKLLYDYFSTKEKDIYKTIAKKLFDRLQN